MHRVSPRHNHLRFGLLGSVADPEREDWGRSREGPSSHLDTITWDLGYWAQWRIQGGRTGGGSSRVSPRHNHLRFGLLGSVLDPGREDWMWIQGGSPGSHLDTITWDLGYWAPWRIQEGRTGGGSRKGEYHSVVAQQPEATTTAKIVSCGQYWTISVSIISILGWLKGNLLGYFTIDYNWNWIWVMSF